MGSALIWIGVILVTAGVVAGVAERVPERIGRLIYLDAMVPANGQKVFDIRPELKANIREISFNGKNVRVLMPHAPEAFGLRLDGWRYVRDWQRAEHETEVRE